MSKRQKELFPDLASDKKYVSDYPELAAEWHQSKNKGLMPEDVLYGAGRKVWWICSEGHEWQSSPNQRTNRKSGCPECYNLIRSENARKATGDFNLLTEKPELCKEWHPRLNSKPPEFYMPHSMDKVWWLCAGGHEWEAVIDSRTSGRGCPYCAGYLASAEKNLAVMSPDLVEEWHPSRNIKRPEQFTPSSNSKVWWRCQKGHEWEAAIYSRSQGTGCPKCSNQQSKNELRILTELMSVYENVEHRTKIVGHEVDIYLPELRVAIEYDGEYWHRNKHKSDLIKQENISKSGVKLIRVREMPLPKISEIDILIDGRRDFKKEVIDAIIIKIGVSNSKIEKYLEVPGFCNSKLYSDYLGCFPSPLPDKSLAKMAPELCRQWHPTKNKQLTPYNFTAKSTHKAWWTCNFGHEYPARISHRYNGAGCPKCSGRIATIETCMAATHPGLAKYFHPTKNGNYTPKNLKAGSGVNIWWQCDNGHEWVASPANMKKPNRRSFCPDCKAVEIPTWIENSMAEVRPDMAAAFHPTKNGDFTPWNLTEGTSRRLWWQCSNDKSHIWQASGTNHKRSPSPGLCPDCRRKLR